MKTLVIIPTYNERENIIPLIRAIYDNKVDADILVVDDNSPDGTAQAVKSMMSQNPRVHVLSRPQKNGLGKAYIAGFQWGMEKGYDWFVEMDADFSHRPQDLKTLTENFVKGDFLIGSRYTNGGGVANWTWYRKLISKGGSTYSRFILGYPVRDWTGGFNAWKRSVLDGIEIGKVESNGYSFQIELKYKALKRGFNGVEVPILFEDRRAGASKMSMKIFAEALYRVWKIRGG